MSSYRRPRTCNSLAGDCSAKISAPIWLMYNSQSVVCTACVGLNGYELTLHVSKANNARRMFRPLAVATRVASSGGSSNFSFFATSCNKFSISSTLGPGTRTGKHRDCNASITRLGLSAMRNNRHDALYFSIVRLKPYCASRDSRSTSVSTKTLNPSHPSLSIGLDRAISLITSCTTYRSLLPQSLGFISQ